MAQHEMLLKIHFLAWDITEFPVIKGLWQGYTLTYHFLGFNLLGGSS